MPRTCTVCAHPELDAINQALIRGQTFRLTAEQFGPSIATLARHKAAHLPVLLMKAAEAAEIVQADNLLASIRSLHARTLAILQKAEDAGQLMLALVAIREAAKLVELQGKLLGQLKDREPGEVHIVVQYIDRAIIAPNATAPRCISAGSVSTNLQSDGRQKGEAAPFDGPQL